MTTNYTLSVIDSYVYRLESGWTKEDAAKAAIDLLFKAREYMSRDDYTRTYELINRLTKC